ncbi:MAG: DUF6065 family protein [Myxococcota bacterium]
MADKPRLLALLRPGARLDIHPASPRRDWMDATPNQHAYKCLPLTIANSHGWEIRCTRTFSVRWTGGPRQDAVRFSVFGDDRDGPPPALSAFGSGIVTFRIPALFRTPPGVNLWVMGPINRPKDAIHPLSGIVETDWLTEYGFTMNWKITRPAVDILFEAGEPICHICPMPRGFVESFAPQIKPMADEPAISTAYHTAEAERNAFQKDLGATMTADRVTPGPHQGRAWQRRYYQGIGADGADAPDHQTRLQLRPFREE